MGIILDKIRMVRIVPGVVVNFHVVADIGAGVAVLRLVDIDAVGVHLTLFAEQVDAMEFFVDIYVDKGAVGAKGVSVLKEPSHAERNILRKQVPVCFKEHPALTFGVAV